MASLLKHIEILARRLPFEIDDSDAVNTAYRQWHDLQSGENQEVLELWTYCYVHRYFTWKFIKGTAGSAADFEELISETYAKVSKNRGRLNADARYASWVSVICRRTFLNFARNRGELVYLDNKSQELLVAEATPRGRDRIILRRQIEAAITRLPAYLQDAAHLRFVRHMEYIEMEDLTGRDAAILRAYCHKAVQKLGEDDALRDYFEKWDDDFVL